MSQKIILNKQFNVKGLLDSENDIDLFENNYKLSTENEEEYSVSDDSLNNDKKNKKKNYGLYKLQALITNLEAVDFQVNKNDLTLPNFMNSLKLDFTGRLAKDIFIIKYFLEKTLFGQSIINENPKSASKTLISLSLYMKYAKVKKNEFVFKYGDPGEMFYIILKGKVNLLKPVEYIENYTVDEYYNKLIDLWENNEDNLLSSNIEKNLDVFYVNIKDVKNLRKIIFKVREEEERKQKLLEFIRSFPEAVNDKYFISKTQDYFKHNKDNKKGKSNSMILSPNPNSLVGDSITNAEGANQLVDQIEELNNKNKLEIDYEYHLNREIKEEVAMEKEDENKKFWDLSPKKIIHSNVNSNIDEGSNNGNGKGKRKEKKPNAKKRYSVFDNTTEKEYELGKHSVEIIPAKHSSMTDISNTKKGHKLNNTDNDVQGLVNARNKRIQGIAPTIINEEDNETENKKNSDNTATELTEINKKTISLSTEKVEKLNTQDKYEYKMKKKKHWKDILNEIMDSKKVYLEVPPRRVKVGNVSGPVKDVSKTNANNNDGVERHPKTKRKSSKKILTLPTKEELKPKRLQISKKDHNIEWTRYQYIKDSIKHRIAFLTLESFFSLDEGQIFGDSALDDPLAKR